MTEFEFQAIQVSLLDFNKGQLDGLPKNPRFFRDYRYDAMKKSIEDSPEMLNLRELIVYPLGERYIVVCGNLRLRACKELGYKELPCKVLSPDTPVKKLREYATKDNVSFGENDMDVMMNDWDKSELQDWGIEFAPEPEKDEFKERFEAITDETAVYPLIPKYDEKYELFIIMSANEVDSNWLREALDMQHMQSHKTGYVAVGKCGRLTQRSLCQSMKEWGDKCGIDKCKMHPHAFRHFFAKMYLKKNNDVVQLADLLGHGSIDTTRIYLQKSYDEQKKEFNRSVVW